MTSTFDVSTYEDMVAGSVRHVFDTMLNYEVQESPEDYIGRTDIVTCVVYFAGVWKGAVVLEFNQAQARLFTERLTNIPQPLNMNDDVRDAMGELVNMIGGNLKSVLAPGVSLSMPSVLEGPDYAYRICGTNKIARYSYRGEAGPIWVTLVQVIEPNK